MQDEVFILYADELVFINFCMDFICLYISGRLCGVRFKAWRLIVASLIGGAYSVAAVFPLPTALSVSLCVAAEAVICAAAYLPLRLREFLKSLLVFALTSAFLGGLITGIYALFGVQTQSIGLVRLLLTSLALSFAVFIYSYSAKKRITVASVRGVIHTKAGDIDAELLIDSGNLATEPFSGLPVIFVSPTVLPPALQGVTPERSPLPLRVIPVSTASSQDILYGFIPDVITLHPRGKAPYEIRAAVAIGQAKRYGFCGGLLPASLVR